MPPSKPIRIAIINPNSSPSMTDALRPTIESLDYNNTTYTYYTAPPSSSSPPSINNPADAASSAIAFTSHPDFFEGILNANDAFLVACYSPHPLVNDINVKVGTAKPVLGIFEASVVAAGALVRKGEGEGKGGMFGIVTTGEAWRDPLERAVRTDLLPGKLGEAFKGVECVGLDAGDLHGGGDGDGVGGGGVVEAKVKAATERLLEDGRVGVVVLGCAGMVGMDQWVRDAAAGGRAGGRGGEIKVVDGVKAGVGILQGLVRMDA